MLCPAHLEGSELLRREADGGGGVACVTATHPAWGRVVFFYFVYWVKDTGNVDQLMFTY